MTAAATDTIAAMGIDQSWILEARLISPPM